METVTSVPRESLWRLLREAMGGSHRDFTRETMGRSILLLAVPMVVEMVMESIFAVVDIFWVSKLGADAVAAVGITESLMTLVYASAMGLSIGAGAVVARRFGEQDKDGAARAGVQAIIIGVALACVVGALGVVGAPSLLRVMGATPAVTAVGSRYAQVMLGGCISVVLIFLINAVFRGAGDAAVAMRTLWLANGLNIVLGPLFVFGVGPFPKLGVMGAAVATTIGRSMGVLYQLRSLGNPNGRLIVRRLHLRIERAVMVAIFRLSRSGMIQVLIGMTSWVVLVRIVSSFGSQAVAGYTIAVRVVMFALLPSWGMANAAATLVGQNLGAQQVERAEQAVWRAGLYNLVFLGTVGMALLAFAPGVVGIFTNDPVVSGHAVHCLRVVAGGFPFYAYGMVMGQAFNGAGDTRTPTILNLVCFWIWEQPVAWFLARPVGWGASGTHWAIASAFSLNAVLALWLFRKGRWKVARV